MRKLSLRLDIRIYNWSEEYGTTVSEYLEHAVYFVSEFGDIGSRVIVSPRVMPKYNTSVYLTDRTYREVEKLARQCNMSKARVLSRSAIMFHLGHIHEMEDIVS
jgi:hypothetical protein